MALQIGKWGEITLLIGVISYNVITLIISSRGPTLYLQNDLLNQLEDSGNVV